jgi:peroxiredoxin Q/BCP
VIEVGERFPVEALPRGLDGPTVVYFYPKDQTPGCELEARTFDSLYDEFRAAGIEVYGVSTDDDASHDAFAQECGLRFPLVPDPEAELTRKLGLLKDYGEYGHLAQRVTLLLDRDGLVRRRWEVDDIGAHPQEALAAAKDLL